jgi:aminopeptidase YwaD
MKKQLLGFLLLLSFVVSVSAQKADPTEANLRRHITYLASDALEGRRTGDKGSTLAADYIAKEFAKLKLKPGVRGSNGKRSFMQPFPYVTGVLLAREGNSFSLDLDGKARAATSDNVRAVGFSPNGNVTNAPVSFAGYGIVAKEANFDDYAWEGRQMGFKGDVVLVFDGNPDNENPHSAFGRFDIRTKALIAKERGSVGLLVISRE